jgi:hypothetical protein
MKYGIGNIGDFIHNIYLYKINYNNFYESDRIN